MPVRELFTQHPHSVGESYIQHQRHAFAFGASMVLAGLACILHGLVPALFPSTGSRTVSRLHDRMVLNRSRLKRRRLAAGAANARDVYAILD